MSILLSALVAIVAIINAQTYEECGTAESISGYTLTVSRDVANQMVKIDISGADSGWFGYGFGTTGMNGAYAVTVEGADSDNLDVAQRILSTSSAPGTDVSYGTGSVSITSGTATGTLTMGYAAADFDFTDFLTCVDDTIPIIIAKGSQTAMNYHGSGASNRRGQQTLTRTCSCDTDTGADTPAPVTPAPVTPAPVTPAPVTPSPVTEAPDDGETTPASEDIVICGESELIDDTFLTLYRDSTNMNVIIEITGSASAWFAYGFGTSVMEGSYAVTVVEGSNGLEVVQRVLGSSSGDNKIGDVKDYGVSEVFTMSGTAEGTVTMGYDDADFDFTDFLTCQSDEIPLIAAMGSDTTFAYHGSNRIAGTLSRASTCTCDGTPSPIESPGDSSANNIFNGFYVMIAAFIGYLLM